MLFDGGKARAGSAQREDQDAAKAKGPRAARERVRAERTAAARAKARRAEAAKALAIARRREEEARRVQRHGVLSLLQARLPEW